MAPWRNPPLPLHPDHRASTELEPPPHADEEPCGLRPEQRRDGQGESDERASALGHAFGFPVNGAKGHVVSHIMNRKYRCIFIIGYLSQASLYSDVTV
jgi:hypothetical protein